MRGGAVKQAVDAGVLSGLAAASSLRTKSAPAHFALSMLLSNTI